MKLFYKTIMKYTDYKGQNCIHDIFMQDKVDQKRFLHCVLKNKVHYIERPSKAGIDL